MVPEIACRLTHYVPHFLMYTSDNYLTIVRAIRWWLCSNNQVSHYLTANTFPFLRHVFLYVSKFRFDLNLIIGQSSRLNLNQAIRVVSRPPSLTNGVAEFWNVRKRGDFVFHGTHNKVVRMFFRIRLASQNFSFGQVKNLPVTVANYVFNMF